MKQPVTGILLTGAAVFLGFALGFGIGQQTRKAAPSNVKTSYNDGKVTIEADVGQALETGVSDYIGSLWG